MSLELVIRICGIAGIVASFGVMVADLLLFGRSDSFVRLPGVKRMIGFPFWRINVGNALGVCLIPIVTLGFVPLFFALRPSGLFAACIAAGLLVYFFGIGPGGHTFYAYNGIVQREREGLSDNSPEGRALDSVSSYHKRIFTVVSIVLLSSNIIGSLVYSILVLTGKTYLPVWMAIINPFFLTGIAYSSFRWAPPAISGYLSPISVYIGVTPLQILTLIYMWNAL